MNVGTYGATVVVAVLAAPTVLAIVRYTTLTAIRLRSIEVIAVSGAVGSLVGLVVVLPPHHLVMLLPLVVLGCAAAVVDAHEGRLPDALTFPLLVATLLAGIFTADGRDGVGTVVISMLAGGCLAVVMKSAVSAGFGWGDAKLVPTLAVVLVRHDAVVAGIVSMSLLVAATAVIIGIRAGRSALVPYGPALVLGTVGAAAL